MNRITFFDLFVKCGLIYDDEEYGYRFTPYVLVLAETVDGIGIKPITDLFFGFNETDRERWVKEFLSYCKEARERNRYYLSVFSERRNSFDFFKRTKAAIRIDIDEPLTLSEVIKLVENKDLIPIQPTHVLRSVRGWHILYITKDFIENDEQNKNIFYLLHSYAEDLKSNLRKYADKVDYTYQIATRFSEEIYELREPYEVKELIKAIEDYYSLDIEINGFKLKRRQFGRIPISHISEGVALTLWNACPVLRRLEEKWEYHTYNEWFIMSWKYAFLYALTGKSEYKEEFLNKSKLWKGVVKMTPEQQFEYTLKWVLKEKETLPYFSCSFVYKHVSEAEEKCKECPYARWQEDEFGNKTLISSWFKELFYIESRLENFKIDEKRNLWVKADTNEPICELFKIEDVVLYNKPNKKERFIKIFYRNKYEFVPYVLTASANMDFSEFNVLTFYNQTLFKNLLINYLNLFQLSRGAREIDKAGYKYNRITKSWDKVVANLGNFRVEDLNFFMWNDRTNELRYYIPVVNGSYEVWRETYKKVLLAKDPIMLIILGHFLSHITREYFKDKFVSSNEPNVLIFLRGFTTSGKTTRLKIASALYGTPEVIQITETTTAKILREFGNIGMPLPLDEFRMRKDKEEEVANMIYAIANEAAKDTAYERFNPISVPVVFSGEKNTLFVETLAKNREGLYRRSIVLDVDEIPKPEREQLAEFYAREIYPVLRKNHGFIYKFIEFLENEADIDRLSELYQDVELLREEFDKRRSKVLRGIVRSLDNHLKMILASLHLFVDFIGLNDEEKAEVYMCVEDYIKTKLVGFYETFLPKEEDKLTRIIDYLRDIIDGLYNAWKHPVNKKTIKRLTINKLIEIAGVQAPTQDLEPYLKLLLMKYYPSNNTFTYVGSVFVEGRNYLSDDYAKLETERLLFVKGRYPHLYQDILEVFVELMLIVHGEYGLSKLIKYMKKLGFTDVMEYTIKHNITIHKFGDDEDDNPSPTSPPKNPPEISPQNNSSSTEITSTSEVDEDLVNSFVGEEGFSSATLKTDTTKQQNQTNTPFTVKVKPANKSLVDPILCNSIDEIPVRYDEPVYFDIETEEDKPVLVSVYQPHFGNKVYCLNLLREKPARFKEWFLKFSEIRGWGLDFDLKILGYTYEQLKNKKIVDVQLAIKVQHYERFKQGGTKGEGFRLDEVARDLLGIEYPMDKSKIRMTFRNNMFSSFSYEQLLYASLDAYIPHLLYERLSSSTLNSLVYQIDQEVQKIVVETSQHGMPVKLQALEEEIHRLLQIKNQIQKEIPFNYNSPQQTAKFFGVNSSSKDVLMDLVLKGNEMAKKVLEARQVEKSLAFAKDLYDLAKRSGGRIYGNFFTTTAPSGRMSCSDINLQQIPRRLRQFIGFETEDKKLITADFPQIELRLAGVIWNEPEFINAFRKGLDLHKLTASILFEKNIEEVSKEERQIGKSANFGLIYGISPRGFAEYCISNGINMTEEMAVEIVRKWKKFYRKIAEQHQLAYERFKYDEYVDNETWLNRPYRAYKPQDLLNYQIQGSGAELFKKAIILIKEVRPDLKLVNLVHDEIVAEALTDEAEDIAMLIKQKMEEAWDYCLEKAKEFGNKVSEIKLDIEKPNISHVWEKE